MTPSGLFRIALLATGGTIEKHYDPRSGTLVLDEPVIETLLAGLSHPDVVVRVRRVMALDSLEMGESERNQVIDAVRDEIEAGQADAVVITHGTDTLARTAAALVGAMPNIACPVVLTGAMVPYRVAHSDAAQNVAQALMACRLLGPGVSAVFHGRVIAGHRIVKDYERLTLVDAPVAT